VRSSVDTTINVLDGLLGYERATGGFAQVRAARTAVRSTCSSGLFRRKSTGTVIAPEYLSSRSRTTGNTTCARRSTTSSQALTPTPAGRGDSRAVKRQPDGRWLLDRVHPGRVHFDLEGAGHAEPLTTLCAPQVLTWWEERENLASGRHGQTNGELPVLKSRSRDPQPHHAGTVVTRAAARQ
jgi:hypothetical protein